MCPQWCFDTTSDIAEGGREQIVQCKEIRIEIQETLCARDKTYIAANQIVRQMAALTMYHCQPDAWHRTEDKQPIGTYSRLACAHTILLVSRSQRQTGCASCD